MDFSRLDRTRVMIGAAGALLLVLSLLLLPWYSLDDIVARDPNSPSYNPEAFICGEGDFSCTGFETFPILRWFLLAGALAPLILAWIIIRGHKLGWSPGEMTMVVGSIATVLIAYNGLLDKPGTSTAEIGISLDYGYLLALLGAIAIAVTGFLRSMAGARQQRKAPGTV